MKTLDQIHDLEQMILLAVSCAGSLGPQALVDTVHNAGFKDEPVVIKTAALEMIEEGRLHLNDRGELTWPLGTMIEAKHCTFKFPEKI